MFPPSACHHRHHLHVFNEYRSPKMAPWPSGAAADVEKFQKKSKGGRAIFASVALAFVSFHLYHSVFSYVFAILVLVLLLFSFSSYSCSPVLLSVVVVLLLFVLLLSLLLRWLHFNFFHFTTYFQAPPSMARISDSTDAKRPLISLSHWCFGG